MIHTVKGFGAVNTAEIDVFLEISCIFNDQTDVGTLIFGSSAFSKCNLDIWRFMVHVLLKPGLENFEHYFANMWDEYNYAVVKHSLELSFFGTGMKTDLFQSCGHCWVFQVCWHIECSTFIASSFRIWNSSTRIPSPPLALFIMMLPKAHLTSHSMLSSSNPVITLLWLSGSLRSFWMASPTQWTWVWVNSGSWWWTGRPGMLQSMGSQRVGHDWAIEQNWRCVLYCVGWFSR